MTGEVRTRFVNRQRFQGFSIPRISHMHEPGDIPKEPIPKVKAKIMELDPNIMAKLRQVRFSGRLGSSRCSSLRIDLFGYGMRFSCSFPKETGAPSWRECYESPMNSTLSSSTKVYLPSVAYTFGAGPFWKCLIKLGYDPCVKPEARM